jgi:hypothetical protein
VGCAIGSNQPQHPEHEGEEDEHHHAVDAHDLGDRQVEAADVIVLPAATVRPRTRDNGSGEQHNGDHCRAAPGRA